MKSLLIRTITGWLLLSLLVIPAVVLPAAFLGKWFGAAYIADICGVAKAQAGELLQVMVSQSEGERNPDRLVQLSATMAALEERTMRQTQGLAAIREAALIDTKGRVLAHNDVTQMAKDTPSRFQDEKYIKIAQRTRRDSIAILPVESYEPRLPDNQVARKIGELVLPRLKAEFPELFVSAYEATGAVYPVDGEIPSGGVVLVVENRAPVRTFAVLTSLLTPAAIAAAGGILGVLVLFLPVLALVAYRKAVPAPAAVHEDIPSVEAMPGSVIDDVDPDFHAPEHLDVDFGEVPLPDFIHSESLSEHSAPHANSAAHAPREVAHSYAAMRPALDEILDAIPVEPD